MSNINVTNVKGRTSGVAPIFPDGLNVSVGQTALIYGDLQVKGTQTVINTDVLEVADVNIGIASTSSKLNNTNLDGAGITIYGSDEDKTLTWDNANGRMAFNTDFYSPNIVADGIVIESVGIGTDNPVSNLEIRDTKANLIVAKDGLTVKSNSDLSTTYDLIQLGAGGALASYSTATATADTQFVHNAYRHSGGNWKYRYADTAARIKMNSPGGAILFENAASGSADGDITFSERMRITSTGGFLLSNGILVEHCKIVSTAWSTTNDISLDDGNVFLNTANLAGTNNTIDITSSNGLNVDLATGDMTSVTLITAVNATTAYINAITIGASAVTESWVGGSAPTDGGGSGYDVYTFNIIKTAANTYVCIANQVKGS